MGREIECEQSAARMATGSEINSLLPISEAPRTEEKVFKGSSMTKRGAFAALSYMSCAVLLVLFNKAALSSYEFPFATVITLCQMMCSCVFLFTLRRWKLVSFSVSEQGMSRNGLILLVPMKSLKRAVPLAISYLFYMLVTMESVRGVNVPMYTTLRRTTVLFTMGMECILAGRRYRFPVVGSVGLIVLGAFLASVRDISFEFYSYALVFLSNAATAVYLATISRVGKSSGLNSFGLMWCNGVMCGPLLLLWTLIGGDLKQTLMFPHLLSPGFLVVMLFSCLLAFFLNYTIFLNTTLNSPLTQTICGNLKDLFTIAFGWILFAGLPFDFLNIVGQCLGFLGSALYAYYKIAGKE